jgi:hypothetical protein
MKGCAKARVVIAAPAKAEERLGRVCEWTICGGFKFDFFIKFLRTNIKCTWILGIMLFPSAAVKQKAKEGLEHLGRGIVLPFSKTQPLRF